MKNLRPLLGAEVFQQAKVLATTGEGLDIATFGFGKGEKAAELIRQAQPCRILAGVFNEEDTLKARTYYGWLYSQNIYKVGVRGLKNSHLKMIIQRGRYPKAIIGSMNAGGGATFECAVLLSGMPAQVFATAFEDYWNNSSFELVPVNLKEVAEKLLDTTFPAQSESR